MKAGAGSSASTGVLAQNMRGHRVGIGYKSACTFLNDEIAGQYLPENTLVGALEHDKPNNDRLAHLCEPL